MKILIPFVILSLTFCAAAQNRRRASGIVKLYSETAFNQDVERLPPRYLGNDPEALLPRLVDFALEIKRGCGKFETTSKCQERLNGMYDRPIYKNLTGRSLLSFSAPVDCDYDADTEKILCKVPINSFDSMTMIHKLLKSGQYPAQNALGVKKNVHFEEIKNIHLNIGRQIPGINVFRVNPTQAEKILPNLRYLFIGELIQPFAEYALAEYTPTINEPEHIKGYNFTIKLEASQVWLYNSLTGEVLQKREFNPEQ